MSFLVFGVVYDAALIKAPIVPEPKTVTLPQTFEREAVKLRTIKLLSQFCDF